MFGELLGLWAASAWHRMGQPENVRLVELGPGRGTMMLDALRAAQVVPAFRAAIVLHLVEISPALQERQQQAMATLDVPVMWHQTLDEVPDGPVIVLANELFDALPVNQAIKQFNGWYERVVEIGHGWKSGVRDGRRGDPAVRAARAAEHARRADRRDLRMARRQSAALAQPAAGASRRRCAGDRLRPRRKRGRRHLAGGRRARLRRSAAVPRRGRSDRPRRFPGACACRRKHGRARVGPDRAGQFSSQSRHREARRHAEVAGLAREARRDRRRGQAPDRRGPHRDGQAVQGPWHRSPVDRQVAGLRARDCF